MWEREEDEHSCILALVLISGFAVAVLFIEVVMVSGGLSMEETAFWT